MRSKFVTLAIACTTCLSLSIESSAQLPGNASATMSNRTNWADGVEQELSTGNDKRKLYFENIFEARIAISEQFTAGLRHTTYQPSYWNERVTGIESLDKKWLQYSRDFYSIRVGNSYTSWGRGLTLSLQEDFDQGLDAGIDGLLLKFNKGPVAVEVIRGSSEDDPAGLTKPNDIEGINTEVSFTGGKVGASYLRILPDGSYLEQKIPGGYVSYQKTIRGIGLVSGWVEASWQAFPNKTKLNNRGWFGSFAVARKGLSILCEYKDYQYEKAFGNLLPFQAPPILQRELISKLMSSHPHNPRYEDEIGWQLEANYKPSKRLGLSFYTAQSSIHHGSPLPSMEEKESPFWEALVETNWKVRPTTNLRFQVARFEEAIWNDQFGIASVHNERTGLLLGIQSPLFWKLTVDGSVEQMMTTNVLRDEDITDQYISATFSIPGTGAFSVSFDHTDDDQEVGGPNWIGAELTAPIHDGIQIQCFGGKERGGIKCSSGRCRLVNPFEGVRIGVEATF
ncbi:MAG: DUF6029 family protein [bacterium]|nr:DUF6029 family protein [bacterium]